MDFYELQASLVYTVNFRPARASYCLEDIVLKQQQQQPNKTENNNKKMKTKLHLECVQYRNFGVSLRKLEFWKLHSYPRHPEPVVFGFLS